jgi:carboxyl-terminal processing protease
MRFSGRFLPVICLIFITFKSPYVIASASGGKTSPPTHYTILTPDKIHTFTCKKIFKNMDRNYILPIEKTFSSRLLDQYLDVLDSTQSNFMASDIKDFEVYRLELGHSMENGDLEPAFEIFNRFVRRETDRLNFMMNNLENSSSIMNFQSEEIIEFASKKKEWPANLSDLESIWRKHLKNDILKLKLSGKSVNSIKDILRSHYKRKLDIVNKTKSEDVFRIYMNAFLGLMDPHTAYYSPRPDESDERSTINIPLPETEIFLQKNKAVMKKLKIKTDDDQSPGKSS